MEIPGRLLKKQDGGFLPQRPKLRPVEPGRNHLELMVYFRQKWIRSEFSGCLLPPPPLSPGRRWLLVQSCHQLSTAMMTQTTAPNLFAGGHKAQRRITKQVIGA